MSYGAQERFHPPDRCSKCAGIPQPKQPSPYYLLPEEARQIISDAQSQRDRLFLRVLWEAWVRVSEAVAPAARNQVWLETTPEEQAW